jgi:hypothetical protein
MRLRPAKFLVILLAFAAASPPPRMVALLRDLGHRHASHAAGGEKRVQSRGRNRVPATPRLAASGMESRLGSGDGNRAPRLPLASEHRPDRLARAARPGAAPPAPRAIFPLRC